MFEYHYKVWWCGMWIVSKIVAKNIIEALKELDKKYPDRAVQFLNIWPYSEKEDK